MPEIEDYSVYNDRMRRSMWDKAFFMDKVPGTELRDNFGNVIYQPPQDGNDVVRYMSNLEAYLDKIVKLGLLGKVKVGRVNYYINEKLVDLLVNHEKLANQPG